MVPTPATTSPSRFPGDTSRFLSGYPAITDNTSGGFSGGFGPNTDNLEQWGNFGQDSQTITVTIAFNYTEGVSDVSFTLFDVDVGTGSTLSFIDQLSSIYGTAADGSLVAPAITTSANNSKSGFGTNQVVTGTAPSASASGDGNVIISYGTTPLTSVTYTYGNDPAAKNNPDSQSIGLHDISYSRRIPEYHPGWIGCTACLVLVFWRHRFRATCAAAGSS